MHKHACEHTSHTHIHVCKAAGDNNNKLVKCVAEMQQQIIFSVHIHMLRTTQKSIHRDLSRKLSK